MFRDGTNGIFCIVMMRIMYKTLLIVFWLAGLSLAGCMSSRVTTTWKSGQLAPGHYNKIMVVGIAPEQKDSLRLEIEKQLTEELTALGYNTVSYRAEFGRDGFSGLSEEATYLQLCNKGIDAVITLALIGEPERLNAPNKNRYTSAYYYSRIWSYRNLAAGDNINRWETILFDLSALEPRTVLQAKHTDATSSGNEVRAIVSGMIRKMTREKVLEKQKKPLPALKPF